jgi:RHS repeat-associated protein
MTALYRYDAAQRLIGLEHRRGLDLLAKIDYTLDKVATTGAWEGSGETAAGSPKGETSGSERVNCCRKSKTQSVLNPLTENYNYDAVDQLSEAKYGTARTVGYQYDAVGNRQWVSDNGMTAHYTANSDNGYTSVDGISTETDLNGNMVSVPGAAYAYDAQNRLTTATVNGVTTEFTYDSRNRVVRRTSGNGTLNLTYSGWNLIEERNGGGELEQVYVHGAGIDEILVMITTTGPAYYHHDGLGSTIALTGENGELLESYRYDAFGAVSGYDSSASALPASPRGNRFLFTGREWLSQAGIYDYRNRVYSAQIGRFLQTDPIRFAAGDVNIYRYCGNEPANSVDPMGLCDKLPKPGDGPQQPEKPKPPGPGGGRGGGANVAVGQGVADAVGKLWNLPNTILGLGWGGVGLIGGAKATLGNNAIQFENHPFMPLGAITIGNTIHYPRGFGPKYPLHNGPLGMHERQHTYQGQMLGPLYLPSNALGLSLGAMRNGNTHGPSNWNERGPQSAPPRPW